MKTIFTLAWRNIWRNKRRTLITAASIVMAVFFAVTMQSIQKGTWDNIVNSVVNYYFGFAQIHQEGYWDDRSLDKAFQPDEKFKNLSADVKQVKEVVPRLESFALASYGTSTQGVLIVGIDPSPENNMTKLKTRLTYGDYITGDDNAALVAEGVAEDMKLGVGDTIVLISQGYHGVNAAGKYPIKGLVKFGSPDLNNQMVYLPLKIAQDFFGAENLVTTLALNIDDKKEVTPAVTKLKNSLPADQYEVMDYKELVPDLVSAREMDAAGNNLVLGILYLIISFGIFGTILMMTKERSYEFGVLTAIGMPRWKLSLIVWLETVALGLIGVIVGILISLPLIYYFYKNPIKLTGEMATAYEKFGIEPLMVPVFDFNIFFNQAILIFIVTTILALYPMLKIRRMKAVEAMRG